MTDDQTIELSIVVPVYNEAEALKDVLLDILDAMRSYEREYELLVVDDGSTDETVAICEQLPEVRLIRHRRNRGVGAARTTGVRQARGHYVAMIDGDGTYPPGEILSLLQQLCTYDAHMCIGARNQEHGRWKWLRVSAKAMIQTLAAYLTRTDIPDLNSGLRVMERAPVLPLLPILPEGHSWVSTITVAFLSMGYDVCWEPIDYYERVGDSTFHPIKDTYAYLLLVVRVILYFHPLRVFLPLSIFMSIMGLGKTCYDIVFYNFHLAPSTIVWLLATIQLTALGFLADVVVKRSRL